MKKRLPHGICKYCKKDFRKRRESSVFCCRHCQCTWIRKNKLNGRKKNLQVKICQFCKKEYSVRLYRSDKTKYCSRSCLAKVHLPKYVKVFGFQKTGQPKHKYKCITDENGKQIREHRYIIQKHLNRKLESWEHVHHIDGNSMNNSIDNLVVVSNSEHQKLEHQFRKSISSSSSPPQEQF